MRSERIDIAAGEPDFRAADHVVLPVATELRAVYPHAHYLCTHMVAWATPPEGERLILFEIDRWDFDWQDDYHFRTPVRLAAGTRVDFEYAYDNSAANPNNPSSPPRRVTYGLESTDEMATLSLTLVADRTEERPMLAWAMAMRDVERSPADAGAWVNLAVAVRATSPPPGADLQGLPHQAAAEHARRALELSPGRPDALRELGISLVELGHADRAEALRRPSPASLIACSSHRPENAAATVTVPAARIARGACAPPTAPKPLTAPTVPNATPLGGVAPATWGS